MKRENKKALYESIMSAVAKQVKKALNEGDISSLAKYCGEYIEDEPGDTAQFIKDAGEFGCKVTFESIHGYGQVEIVGPRDGLEMLLDKWYGPDAIDMIEPA